MSGRVIALASVLLGSGCSLVYPFSEFSFRADAAPTDVQTVNDAVTDARVATDGSVGADVEADSGPDVVIDDEDELPDAAEDGAKMDLGAPETDPVDVAPEDARSDAGAMDVSARDVSPADVAMDRSVDLGPGLCPSGQTRCNGGCVALATDANNCGACGSACLPGAMCAASACSCGDSGQLCCSSRCSAGLDCVSGLCVRCPTGLTPCSDRCHDLQRDQDACGACGVGCHAGQICREGACIKASACSVGPGGSCAGSAGCCAAGLQCNAPGTCCASVRTACTAMSGQCCAGSACVLGNCCAVAGETCTVNTDCCSRRCVGFRCGSV